MDETIPNIISDSGANLEIALSPLINGHTTYETIFKIGALRDNAEHANKNKIGETTAYKLLFVIMAIIATIDIVATLYITPITIILIKYNILVLFISGQIARLYITRIVV